MGREKKIKVSFFPTILDVLLETTRNKYVQLRSGIDEYNGGFSTEQGYFGCIDLEIEKWIDYFVKDYDIIELPIEEKKFVKEFLSPQLLSFRKAKKEPQDILQFRSFSRSYERKSLFHFLNSGSSRSASKMFCQRSSAITSRR